MADDNDWRLQGQERYLHGAVLVRRQYRRSRSNLDWDHDRCEFCWTRFAPQKREGCASEGFHTEDHRWICESCYEDFKVIFDWRLEG